MQTNVATPTKPTILEIWDLQEGCHSNTRQDEDRIRIYGERKYYGVSDTLPPLMGVGFGTGGATTLARVKGSTPP